jgi:cysteine desulfurase
MGIEAPIAQTALRFTFGRDITAEDLDAAATELAAAVTRISG